MERFTKTQLLHSPMRLAIVVHLYKHGEQSLAAVRDGVRGSSHAPIVCMSPQLSRAYAAQLQRAGLISTRFVNGITFATLTADGAEALMRHRRRMLRSIPVVS